MSQEPVSEKPKYPRDVLPDGSAEANLYTVLRDGLPAEHWLPLVVHYSRFSETCLCASRGSAPEHVLAAMRLARPKTVKAMSGLDLPEWIPDCDLLYLDVARDGTGMYAALDRLAGRVRSRIAIPGTEVCGFFAEGASGKSQEQDPQEGTLAGIAAFLREHPATWELESHCTSCGGLTTLHRVWSVDMPSRGFGDTLAKAAQKSGISRLAKDAARWLDIPCGCEWRQKLINRWFGYPEV